jgi:hypothetical protein
MADLADNLSRGWLGRIRHLNHIRPPVAASTTGSSLAVARTACQCRRSSFDRTVSRATVPDATGVGHQHRQRASGPAVCVGSLLAGLAGALIGLAGVLLGSWVTSRNEDRRWLRDQKLKSEADFITAGTHLYESQLDGSDQRRLTTADRVAWQDKLQTARSVIHLVCRAETRGSADEFARLVWRAEGTTDMADQAEVVEVLQTFTMRIRQEIRSDR